MNSLIEIDYTCRICSANNVNNKYIFDKDRVDLLEKIRTTFSPIVSMQTFFYCSYVMMFFPNYIAIFS